MGKLESLVRVAQIAVGIDMQDAELRGKARRVTTARMKTVMPGRSVVAGPALPMTGSRPMQ